MAVDLVAREAIESQRKALDDLYGTIGGMAADVSAARREAKDSKKLNAAVVAVGVALIGAVTQFQVGRLNAPRAEQANATTELARMKELANVEARLDAKLGDVRTEIERQRRGSPAPLNRVAEVVVGR